MCNIARISFVLIVIFVLFACAGTEQYNQKLNSFIGLPQSELIAKMGKPSAKKIVNDYTEVWAYTKVDKIFVPSEFYTYNQGNEIYEEDGLFSPFLSTYLFSNNAGDLGYEAKYICKTLFLIQEGKVIAWKWQGNDCNDKNL